MPPSGTFVCARQHGGTRAAGGRANRQAAGARCRRRSGRQRRTATTTPADQTGHPGLLHNGFQHQSRFVNQPRRTSTVSGGPRSLLHRPLGGLLPRLASASALAGTAARPSLSDLERNCEKGCAAKRLRTKPAERLCWFSALRPSISHNHVAKGTDSWKIKRRLD